MRTSAVREAAYARVSTTDKEQLKSYETQKRTYEKQIKETKGSVFAGLYCDKESGKSIAGRKGFQDLLKDCYAGKIDRIRTKNVERFARNMVECVQVCRDLKNRGITIYFEALGLDTAEESSFILLGFLAAQAEEYIRTLSNNVGWGIRKRMAEGKVHMTGQMLGYRIKKGKFKIVPEEAAIVGQIYRDYLQGLTVRQIGAKLEQQGAVTARGKTVWQHTTILSILTNEKYVGDVMMQKTLKIDVLSPRIKNNKLKPIRPMTEIKNNHVGIIDRVTFDAVQAEMHRREMEGIALTDEKVRYSSQYPLSARLNCGVCGTKLRRHMQRDVIIWVCVNHQNNKTACAAKPIKEKVVEHAFVTALLEMHINKNEFISSLNQRVAHFTSTLPQTKSVEDLQKEVMEAEAKLVQISRRNKQADKDEGQEIVAHVRRLRFEMEVAEKIKGAADFMAIKAKEIKQIIKLVHSDFNESVFRATVEKVIIRGKQELHFVFKCGLEMPIKLTKEMLKEAA